MEMMNEECDLIYMCVCRGLGPEIWCRYKRNNGGKLLKMKHVFASECRFWDGTVNRAWWSVNRPTDRWLVGYNCR